MTLALLLMAVGAFVLPASAEDENVGSVLNAGVTNATGQDVSKLEKGSVPALETRILKLVNQVLTIVAALFFAFVVYGGLMWMTAGGNEERTASAMKVLTAAVIGFIIVIMSLAISYAITRFVESSIAVPAETAAATTATITSTS